METAPPSADPQVVDLARMSLPRLMFALLHRRFTGTISLTPPAADVPGRSADAGARRVWFQGGMPIFTDFSSPHDSIGQVLVDLGLIEPAERDRARAELDRLAQPGAPRERFGHYLVRRRLLTGGQLRKALRVQCARKVVHLFALRTGTVQIVAGDAAAAETDASQPTQVNSLELIHAGVVAHFDPRRIAAEMGLLLDGPLRLRSSFDRYRNQFHFSRGDEAIVDALRPGNLYVTDVARLSGQPEARVAAVVYTLWACQMLKSANAPPEQATGPNAALPEATGSSIPVLKNSRPAGRDSLRAAEFAGELERLEAAIAGGANAFDLLGLATTADRAQIRAAWHVLSRRFHPDSLPHQGLGHLRERSQAVFAALSEAYQRLSDDAQREQIVALLRGGQPITRVAAGPSAQQVLESEMVVREGDKLLRAGNFDRALERYRAAAALNPEELEIRAALAWCEYQLAADKAAVRDATRAALFEVLARQPRCVRAHYDLGLLSLGSGDDEQALLHFNQVLELEPDSIDAKRQIHAIQLRRSTPEGPRRKLFGPRR
ncbi:DUF4388 domain-containing protein [Nannocystis pusilla]|uniref:DUF4388 domain-containing protein n=1 Tax=Nannocystis pusilla TaxID=889268 RepID=UPI003DA50E76